MAIAELDHWNEDPEFRDSPPNVKARVYQNYFDKEMADDEFRNLPQEEQSRIKSNFLGAVDISQSESTTTAPTSTPKQATALKADPGYAPIQPADPTPVGDNGAIGGPQYQAKISLDGSPEVDLPFTPEERVSMSRGENTEETFKAALSRLSESNPDLRPAIEKEFKDIGAPKQAIAIPVSDAPPQAEQSAFGKRPDGTEKGDGFLGVLKRPDGGVSTEMSIGVSFNGKETLIPSIVPTLSKEEVDYLLNFQPGEGKQIPRPIVDKAVAHARKRITEGKSPFADPEDKTPGIPKPTDILNSIKERKDVSWGEIATTGVKSAFDTVSRSNVEAVKASAEALKRQIESRQVETPGETAEPGQSNIQKPVGRPNTAPPSGKGFYGYATIPKDIITKDRVQAIDLLNKVTNHLETKSILAKPDKFYEYKQRLKESGFGKQFVNDVVGVLPQILEMGVASAAGGPVASTAAIFAQILGSSYPQYLEKANGDKDRAFTAAFTNALAQAPMEQIGFSKIKSIFNLKSPLAKRLRNWVEAGLTEGTTEYLQSYPEKGTEIYAEAPPTESISDILSELAEQAGTADFQKEALYQGAVGGAAGLLMGAPGLITRQSSPQNQPQQPELPGQAIPTETPVRPQDTQPTAEPIIGPQALPGQMDVVDYNDNIAIAKELLDSGEMTVQQLESELSNPELDPGFRAALEPLLIEYKEGPTGDSSPPPTPMVEPPLDLPEGSAPPSMKELKALAEEQGIVIEGPKSRDKLIAALEAKRLEQESSEAPIVQVGDAVKEAKDQREDLNPPIGMPKEEVVDSEPVDVVSDAVSVEKDAIEEQPEPKKDELDRDADLESVLAQISKRKKVNVQATDQDGNVTTVKVNAAAELTDITTRQKQFDAIMKCLQGL
jgi:hypothetical protein